jgi:hypothetical protein
VAQPLRQPIAPDEAPSLDPASVEQAYLRERARRRARERQTQEAKLARVRYYAVMGTLLALTIVLLVLVWHEVRQLFGI